MGGGGGWAGCLVQARNDGHVVGRGERWRHCDAISMLPGNRNTIQQTITIGSKLSSDRWNLSIQATFPKLQVDSKEWLYIEEFIL